MSDFFIDSRQTELPLIGVSIPTVSFFIFAPILGAALHVYLHLLIRKATEALAAPPPRVRKTPANPEGVPLENPVLPWLLNDLVLRTRKDGAAVPRPLDWLAVVTAILLIWWAAPLVLALTWVTSMPAHEEGLTLAIATCVAFTLYASLQSWVKLRADLQRPWLKRPMISALVFALSLAGWAALAGATILTTEGGLDRLTDKQRPDWAKWRWTQPVIKSQLAARDLPDWARTDGLLVGADLQGVIFAALPPEEVDPDTARHRFRAEWCERHGLDPDVCGRGAGSETPGFEREVRRRWCTRHPIEDDPDCTRFFAGLEVEFDDEWTSYPTRTIAALDKPDLAGRDLRNANLVRAQLPGINLDAAELAGANLSGAQIEEASFDSARMMRVSLGGAQMRLASFSGADMSGANLNFVKAEKAYFGSSRLLDANLRYSHLNRAEFGNAMLNGADIRDTQIRSAMWVNRSLFAEGASLENVVAHNADLRGGEGLSQDMLSLVIGNEGTLLPIVPTDLHVWTCWADPPENFEERTELAYMDRAYAKGTLGVDHPAGEWLCSELSFPQATGTPLALGETPQKSQ